MDKVMMQKTTQQCLIIIFLCALFFLCGSNSLSFCFLSFPVPKVI
jgi:hypothetical protein